MLDEHTLNACLVFYLIRLFECTETEDPIVVCNDRRVKISLLAEVKYHAV